MLKRFVNVNFLVRTLIFFTVVLIITAMYSKERKFRYEFKKNLPWTYENLYAAFDFSINKFPEEYQREIDSIKNNNLFYFEYDESIKEIAIESFKNYYEKNLNSFLQIRSADVKKFRMDLFKHFENEVIILLKFIYDKGVIDLRELDVYSNRSYIKLVFKKDNFVRTYLNEQIFDINSAKNYLINNLNKYYSNSFPDYFREFISTLNLKDFVRKNLRFDKEKTDLMLQQALKYVSKTAGYKKYGELIISRGEIVDNQKYRILVSYKEVYENKFDSKTYLLIFLSQFVFTTTILWIFLLFIRHNYQNLYRNIKTYIGILFLIVLFVILFRGVQHFKIANIYLIPLAILPISIRTFYDERLSLFTLLITVIFVSLTVKNSFDFVLIQFFSSTASVLVIPKLTRREMLYISAISVIITMSLIYTTLNISSEGTFSRIETRYYGYFLVNGILVMLSYPFIYIIEKTFGLLSEFTLLELSNTNHFLLQRLSTTAPGTFQHSIEVASLAEAAANEIGCNSLLAKVGALYHDIGKSANPIFFSENQFGGYNPHDNIDYEKSAKMIIDHVAKGIYFAKKYGLPEPVIDFIRTHHGTTTTQYFYKHFIMKYPDKVNEIDKFTYPGPKPNSKETAIVMMSDAIEAATRSLKNHSPDAIAETVERIFESQMNSKQYEDTDLTFQEIKTLKKFFKQRLLNIYHIRIQYPK